MLDDFTLITHKFDDAITIYPISDVHYGALEHNQDMWTKFLKKLDNEPDSYLILDGDLINNSVRTSVANPFDEVVRPREQKKRMVEFLTPIKDRILCATSGNHEYRSMKDDDVDITYDIMSKLDLEDLYRPNICFMKIQVGKRPNDSRGRYYQTYTFAVTHGAGGGGAGATVNRNERFSYIIDGLDCLVVGHTHKGTVTKPSKIIINTNDNIVYSRDMTVISSVSWLDWGGYAAKKMLTPATTCKPQKLHLLAGSHEHDIEVVW